MRRKQRAESSKWKVKSIGMTALLTISFSLSTLSAQETVNATGGYASNGGGSVSYSVGQLIYNTHSGASGSVTPGVQQPYEISVVSGFEEALSLYLSVSAYPNPTADYLILKLDKSDINNLSFQLYDVNGNLLQQQIITSNETSIEMNQLAAATYFVKIIQNERIIITLKIIKSR